MHNIIGRDRRIDMMWWELLMCMWVLDMVSLWDTIGHNTLHHTRWSSVRDMLVVAQIVIIVVHHCVIHCVNHALLIYKLFTRLAFILIINIYNAITILMFSVQFNRTELRYNNVNLYKNCFNMRTVEVREYL